MFDMKFSYFYCSYKAELIGEDKGTSMGKKISRKSGYFEF